MAVADSFSYSPGVSVRMPTRARTSSGCSVGRRSPSTAGASLGRLDQRGQQPDGRGLARAVGSEQAEDLAARHLEVHPADRPELAEPAAQAGRAEHHGVGHGHAAQSDGACHNRSCDRTVEPPRADGDRPTAHAQRRPRGPARRSTAAGASSSCRRPTRRRPPTGARRTSRASGRWPAPGTCRTTPTSRCRSRACRPTIPEAQPDRRLRARLRGPGGLGRPADRAPRRRRRERPDRRASTATRSGSARTRTSPPSST